MKNIEYAFRYIFIVLIAIIIGIKCAYLYSILPSALATAGTIGIILLCIVAFVFFQRLLNAFSLKIIWLNQLSYKKMIAIIMLFSLITKLLAIAIFRIESLNDGSDIDVYVTTALELGTTGVATSYAGYLTSFSHMFWFGCFLAPVASIFGISQIAFSIYLSIILTISSALLFSAFAEQVGKHKSFLVFLLINALPGTILLPQYITHEIALQFFESIAIWLYFRCLPNCKNMLVRMALFVFFVFSLLFATMMNAAGLVMCIAFGLLFFVKFIRACTIKSFGEFAAKAMVLVGIICIGSTAAVIIQREHCDVPENYILEDKLLWTLYVGSNVEHSGQWNLDDSVEFSSYDQNLSYDEIQQFRKDKVITRYQQLLNNPSDWWCLIKQKLITIWGVFGYSILFTNETIPNPSMQEIYNSLLDRPLLLIEYAASVISCIICLVDVIRQRKESSDFILLIQLFLMGTTAMLILTECRNKYVIAIQPFFWMACFALSRINRMEAADSGTDEYS